ncbi:hypothetical protein LDE04_00200 [Lactobacillus delbrueckii subsp. lactis]|nr:hypothetical protein LDE04_00200 [Lactobacillus delbrueckii subsp. lactis]
MAACWRQLCFCFGREKAWQLEVPLALLAINYLLKREETWAWTLALVLNLVFAALTMLPHQFMSFPAA